MVKKIKIELYKDREGQDSSNQYAYNGVALNPITQLVVETLNEMIESLSPTVTKTPKKYKGSGDYED